MIYLKERTIIGCVIFWIIIHPDERIPKPRRDGFGHPGTDGCLLKIVKDNILQSNSSYS